MPKYLPVLWEVSRFCQFISRSMLLSVVLRGENGISNVFCKFNFRAEYWDNRWKRCDNIGSDCLQLVITIPMSSANALSVGSNGRLFSIWVSIMSMQSTNKVGDSGHPCLTPDFSSKDG